MAGEALATLLAAACCLVDHSLAGAVYRVLRKSWWLCWENHWLVPLLCLFQLFTSGGRHRTGRVVDLVPHDAGGGNGWSTKPALPHFLDTLNRNDSLISEATGRDIDNRFEKSGVGPSGDGDCECGDGDSEFGDCSDCDSECGDSDNETDDDDTYDTDEYDSP